MILHRVRISFYWSFSAIYFYRLYCCILPFSISSVVITLVVYFLLSVHYIFALNVLQFWMKQSNYSIFDVYLVIRYPRDITRTFLVLFIANKNKRNLYRWWCIKRIPGHKNSVSFLEETGGIPLLLRAYAEVNRRGRQKLLRLGY